MSHRKYDALRRREYQDTLYPFRPRLTLYTHEELRCAKTLLETQVTVSGYYPLLPWVCDIFLPSVLHTNGINMTPRHRIPRSTVM